jgi:hypothetical protein
MKFFLPLLLLVSSCTYTADDVHLRRVENEVDKIMEAMDLPEYGLVKLAKKGEYTGDFIEAGRDLIKAGSKMTAIEHPDAEFNQFSRNMMDAFKHFEKALESKDSSTIKQSWQLVQQSCVKCHDVYD